jgi:hypothetical protein
MAATDFHSEGGEVQSDVWELILLLPPAVSRYPPSQDDRKRLAKSSARRYMSKNPPDWWARFFAGLGIIIGVGGLVLTYNNYRWQKAVYEKSLEERILVQLSGEYRLSLPLAQETELSPTGKLAVEVVNLGTQPIYLKSVTVQIGEHSASFYKHNPLTTNEPMRRLEPAEAASYKVEWPPLVEDIDKEWGTGIVEVETTKKRFSQSAQISRITVDYVTLLQLIPRKKK